MCAGIGWWELGDTWESTVFLFFQLFPLIWCGVCYSLGTKFRLPLYTNYPVLLVWGALFFSHMIMLLVDANDFSSVFHIGSNAFNGFNTESPVWMRYQMPLGCPDASSTLAYNQSVGLGSWRSAMPSASTCEKVALSVSKCGPDCAAHDAQPPSPGMPLHVRGVILLLVVLGMVFMLGWEVFINQYYIKPTKWEEELQDKAREGTAEEGDRKTTVLLEPCALPSRYILPTHRFAATTVQTVLNSGCNEAVSLLSLLLLPLWFLPGHCCTAYWIVTVMCLCIIMTLLFLLMLPDASCCSQGHCRLPPLSPVVAVCSGVYQPNKVED